MHAQRGGSCSHVCERDTGCSLWEVHQLLQCLLCAGHSLQGVEHMKHDSRPLRSGRRGGSKASACSTSSSTWRQGLQMLAAQPLQTASSRDQSGQCTSLTERTELRCCVWWTRRHTWGGGSDSSWSRPCVPRGGESASLPVLSGCACLGCSCTASALRACSVSASSAVTVQLLVLVKNVPACRLICCSGCAAEHHQHTGRQPQ